MRILGPIAAALLVTSCGSGDDPAAPPPGNENQAPAPAGVAPVVPAGQAREGQAARWDLQSSGEGVALAFRSGPDAAAIRLFCPAGRNSLLVNVPAFKPVGSEERLSFGSGGEAFALVADPRGDAARGGVSGQGAIPANLAALIAGPVSASYGAQKSGPHPAPARNLARDFAAACGKGRPAAPPLPSGPAAASGPCHLQDGKPLAVKPLRAVGTEPFWGARIEGRCVTYSHPEDQKGTRIWTRHAPAPGGGGTWSGALGGRPFELRTRPAPGCSDGMSDDRYPIAVELAVAGERRTGCAKPS